MKAFFALIILALACSAAYGQTSVLNQGTVNTLTNQLGGVGADKWMRLPLKNAPTTTGRKHGFAAIDFVNGLPVIVLWDTVSSAWVPVISDTGGGNTYTAGWGLNLSGNEFKVDSSQLATQYDISNLVPNSRIINTQMPLVGGGSLDADLTLGIEQAGNSSDGYLSQPDWVTFNDKLNASDTTNLIPTITTLGDSLDNIRNAFSTIGLPQVLAAEDTARGYNMVLRSTGPTNGKLTTQKAAFGDSVLNSSPNGLIPTVNVGSDSMDAQSLNQVGVLTRSRTGFITSPPSSSFYASAFEALSALRPENTQSWPIQSSGHPTLTAGRFTVVGTAGATGTIPFGACIYATFANDVSNTFTQAALLDLTFSGSTNADTRIGIKMTDVDGPTNNVGIYMASGNEKLPPSGDWGIYDSSTFYSAFTTGIKVGNPQYNYGSGYKIQTTGNEITNGLDNYFGNVSSLLTDSSKTPKKYVDSTIAAVSATIPVISGTNNTVTKFTSASTVGNSSITDDGANVSTALPMSINGGTVVSGNGLSVGFSQYITRLNGIPILNFRREGTGANANQLMATGGQGLNSAGTITAFATEAFYSDVITSGSEVGGWGISTRKGAVVTPAIRTHGNTTTFTDTAISPIMRETSITNSVLSTSSDGTHKAAVSGVDFYSPTDTVATLATQFDISTKLNTSAISGTNNTLTKFTSSSTIGNSSIVDNGTTITTALPVSLKGGTIISAEGLSVGTAIRVTETNNAPFLGCARFGTGASGNVIFSLVGAGNNSSSVLTNFATVQMTSAVFTNGSEVGGVNFNTLKGGSITPALTANGDTVKIPAKLQVNSGILSNGGGLKHSRVSTGSITSGSTALVTIAWTTAFADANYTVNTSVVDATTSSLSLSVVHIESITASAVTVRVLNSSAGSLTGTIHCVAIHD